MKSLFSTPHFDEGKNISENLRDLYASFSDFIELLNRERSGISERVIYSGSTSSGTAKIPLDTGGYRIFVAVISGVPTLAVLVDGIMAGRGGDNSVTTSISATIYGPEFTFTASGNLEKLIAIK